MMQPKRTKYRSQQKGRFLKGIATRGAVLNFAKFGLKALEPGFISANQLEMIRIIFSRAARSGGGSMFRRIFPTKPISKKPAEVRMGKGKGSLDHWVAPVKPGTIIYEIDGVSQEIAQKAINLAGSKLGIKTRMVIDKTR